MSLIRLFALVLLAVSVPVLASGIEFSGQSRTYLQSRESADSRNLLPLYEYLDFRTDNIASENVSFHFGGWARADLASETLGKKTNNDLQYAYLSMRKNTGNGMLNLGRFFVREGAASELIDGAYARTDLRGGLGIAAYGGIPVETNFDSRSGDSIYGGRVSQGDPGVYRIGFSYLKEKNNSADFRKEEGADLWFRPATKVEILGASSYNALTSAWMQHNYSLILGPVDKVTLRTEVTYISYKDYFTAATTSAFTFGPGSPIGANEKLSTTGGELSYSFGRTILSAEYRKYSYDIAGGAHYYGAQFMYSDPKNRGTGISLHRMSGEADNLKYYEYRAYAYKKFSKADITADIIAVSYDAEISGMKNAYTAIVAGGYSVMERARLVADIEYAHNPYFDREVKGLVKFVYNFGGSYGAKRGR